MVDVTTLADERLKIMMANYQRLQRTRDPVYGELAVEWNRRRGAGLDLLHSTTLVWRAARERRCLSYKDLAEASGADWNTVRFAVGEHLWALCHWAHERDLPLLSAVVVNKSNVGTGRMDPATLRGFVGAAELLGYQIADPESFLKDQQEACFDWAANSPKPDQLTG